MIPGHCELQDVRTHVVCRDPGASRELRFKNESGKRLVKIQIDDCVPLNGKRCDFMVREECGLINYVELKGRNVEDGVEQLKNTISQLRGVHPANSKVRAFLICNESPSVTQMQRFKPAFVRNTKADLIIRTRRHTVCV